MLRQLYIENVAVIEKVQVDFIDGFNIFTGETGAGKSIVIHSLNTILGVRTSKDIVRTGTDKAYVSAVFEDVSKETLDKLEELGYPLDEGENLLLTREIHKGGKNVCKVCGRPATVSILREVGETLISIHGQNDNRRLMDIHTHTNVIDTYGDNQDILVRYKKLFGEIKKLTDELNKVKQISVDNDERAELIRYQLDEIEKAGLLPGEEQELVADAKRFKNVQEILAVLSDVSKSLSGDIEVPGVIESINSMSTSVEGLAEYFDDAKESSDKLKEIYYALEDISGYISSKINENDNLNIDINEVEERLDLIYRLKRKYGENVSEIEKFFDSKTAELETIENSESIISELEESIKLLKKDIVVVAKELTEARADAAKAFNIKLVEELRFLDMESVSFEAYFHDSGYTSEGKEKIEFLISTNLGEPPKSLVKTSSGGELSRIMLSIENVLANKNQVETMIFDEVDTGVSGRAAYKIGLKLKQVASGRQVICITHLPQIAALAGHHIFIEKTTSEGRTFTTATPVVGDDRVHEIARIITGDNITQVAIEGAREMLEPAK